MRPRRRSQRTAHLDTPHGQARHPAAGLPHEVPRVEARPRASGARRAVVRPPVRRVAGRAGQPAGTLAMATPR